MMTRTAIHPLKIVAAVGAAFLLWGLVLAYTSSPAQAASITVNSLADDADGTDGECTLREAITAANTDPTSEPAAGECANGSGHDLINFALPGTAPWTVNLTGALPELSSSIEMEGPGADQFTVRRDTGGDYRIFTVTSGSVVSISGMTISNGNTTLPAGGGGINNFRGTLTITGSTISGNFASFDGGGISNNGGTLTVTGSTISDNSAIDGGGIYSDTNLSGVTTTITNSTISGNTARLADQGDGGGVRNFEGLTVIEFSTITDNTALNDRGSGVASFGDTSTRTEVLSTIISANQGTDVDSGTTTNSFVSKGHNLIGDGNATAAFNQSGDQSGVSDPKLNALGDYGGPTQTHSLKSGSPARNVIPSATNGCGTDFTTDQRGVARPQGGKCEIGSFEDRSPWVKRVVPTEDAAGVAPATNVRAFFSEGMSVSSINVNTVKLFKEGTTKRIEAQVSYDAVSKRAILNPNSNLALGTRYKAVVTTGVRDLGGNQLDQDQTPSNGNQPKVWFFTVRN